MSAKKDHYQDRFISFRAHSDLYSLYSTKEQLHEEQSLKPREDNEEISQQEESKKLYTALLQN